MKMKLKPVLTEKQPLRSLIVWDFDNTIAATQEYRHPLLKAALAQYSGSDLRHTGLKFGCNFRQLVAPIVSDNSYDDFVLFYADVLRERPTKLCPSARQVLEAFISCGYENIIVSASDSRLIAVDLSQLGIDHLISLVIGSEKFLHAKGSPEFLHELEDYMEIGTIAAVIGDSPSDEALATSIGCRFIGVQTGAHCWEAGKKDYHAIFDSCTEVIRSYQAVLSWIRHESEARIPEAGRYDY